MTYSQPPPFRPILSGEGAPPPPSPPEEPNWFLRHKVLTFVLVMIGLVGFVAAANDGAAPTDDADEAPAAVPSAAETARESEETPESGPAPEPEFLDAEKHRGRGDDVITTNWPAQAGVVTFKCAECSGNTVVQSDGPESLLINTIGPYEGTRWINVNDSAMTTSFTINATGSWTLTIADLDTVKQPSGQASGTGDEVVYLDTEATKAAISNRGQGNFVVEVISDDRMDLAVNEIGSYSGTVPLRGPALIQVTSEGNWVVDPS